MAAQREVRVDPGLERLEAKLGKSGCFDPGELVVLETGEGRSGPQIEGICQSFGGEEMRASLTKRSSLDHGILEAEGVDRLPRRLDHISGSAGGDQILAEPAAES